MTNGANQPGDGVNTSLLGVTRTICIGVGGTGRDVLMRIRRTIIDQFGSLANFPIVAFVQIDTEQGALSGNTSPYMGQAIGFNPAETVHTSVDVHQVQAFQRNHQLRQKNPHAPNPDSDILDWFPDGLVNNLSAIQNGAGKLRPVGRFAFFKNCQSISNALYNAYNRVTAAPVANLIQKGINVQPGLKVFVTGSLCGGTGSGMVIDMGYLVRALFANRVPTECHGYFVIAPSLYGGDDSVKANTYAALMELDYYTRVGTQFAANFPGMPPFQASWEPYEFLYLFSNSTPNAEFALTDGDAKGKLTNLIAQKVCLFFTSNKSANAAVAARDNLNQMVNNNPVDNHPRPNRQRYFTAGMSTIYFPQDRILALAANQTKQTLINFWQNGVGQAPNPVNVLNTFLIQYQWNNGQNSDPIQRNLQALPLAQNQSFEQMMRAWNQNQQGLINTCQNRQQQDNLMTQLSANFDAQFRLVQQGDTEATQGTYLTQLINGTNSVSQSLVANIDQFITELLNPVHTNFSLTNANNWLYALIAKIQTDRNRYEQSLQQQIVAIPADINTITSQLVQGFNAVQSGWWPWGKNPKIQSLCRDAVQNVSNKIKANYTHQLLRRCIQVSQELENHVNNKLAQLNQLNQLLNNLSGYYTQRETQFRAMNNNERIGLALVDDLDVTLAVNKLIPNTEPDRRQQLNSLSHGFIQQNLIIKDPNKNSLAEFLNPNLQNQQQVQNNFDAQIDQDYAGATIGGLGSAIHRFMKSGTPAQLQAQLTQLWRESQYLLPLLLTDGNYNDAPNKFVGKVAFHDSNTNDPYITAFCNLLVACDINATPVNLTADEQHHVIFMTEYAGFPLRLINDLYIQNMQFAYRNAGQNGDYSHLHTDKNLARALSDIIPPAAQLMDNLMRVFFQSLALGFFDIDKSDGSLLYRQDGHNVSLGSDWSAAIDKLAFAQQEAERTGGETLISFLTQNLEEAKKQIDQEPRFWTDTNQGYRKKVLDRINEIREYKNVANHINLFYVDKVAGTGPMVNPGIPVRRGILEYFIDEIDKRIGYAPIPEGPQRLGPSGPLTPPPSLQPSQTNNDSASNNHPSESKV